MSEKDPTREIDPPKADDLALIDGLDDAGKDESELWNELDQADAAASPPATDEPPADDAAASADTGDDQRADDKDEGKTGEDTPSGDSDAGEDAGQAIWSGATEAQRAAFDAAQARIKRLEQADRSHRGRTSALQRQLDELRTAGRTGSRGTGAAGTDKEGDEGLFDSEDWKSLAGEYPEVAKPLERIVGSLQATIDRQNKELDAIGSDRRTTALNEQADLLVQEHADWQEVAATDEFEQWIEDQPRHIRDAAYRNATEIVDAEEAADVIGRFKAFRSEQEGEVPSGKDTPGKTDAGETTAGDGDGNGTTQLSGKRRRQLESAESAPSRGAGPSPMAIPEDGDEQAIWNAFDEVERRQAGS